MSRLVAVIKMIMRGIDQVESDKYFSLSFTGDNLDLFIPPSLCIETDIMAA